MSEFSVARRAAVWVLPLESGGCGATLQSIYALQAPRYAAEVRAAGVSFARSPRHADIVLIAGPLSQAAREPFARMLAAVPQPRALVAVGNCAIDGCVFAASPHITPHPAEELDAHVEVGGCPPAPSAILAAIVEAKRLLAGQDDTEDESEVDEVDEDEEDESAEAVTSEAAAGEDDER
jgi:Ni,Fe-hydrogenase III small subunit